METRNLSGLLGDLLDQLFMYSRQFGGLVVPQLYFCFHANDPTRAPVEQVLQIGKHLPQQQPYGCAERKNNGLVHGAAVGR